jgi:hypothetical protein
LLGEIDDAFEFIDRSVEVAVGTVHLRDVVPGDGFAGLPRNGQD